MNLLVIIVYYRFRNLILSESQCLHANWQILQKTTKAAEDEEVRVKMKRVVDFQPIYFQFERKLNSSFNVQSNYTILLGANWMCIWLEIGNLISNVVC